MMTLSPSSLTGLALRKATQQATQAMALKSLRGFVKTMYPAFKFAPHNLLMMEALMMVHTGLIKRLIITMPPRHGKTELSSKQFPAFALAHDPTTRVVLCSYNQQLPILNSRGVRAIVRSPEYQALAPRTQISDEKGSEKEWETTAGGGLLAVGVGSGLTGRGADLMVIDDPVKDAEEARSATTLESIFQWYATVARTRLQPGGAIVVVMTRWAEYDLVGRLLMEAMSNDHSDQWRVLHLRAIAREHDILDRTPGEALWPDAYPLDDLLAIRALDEKQFNALYQGEPVGDTDRLFGRDLIELTTTPANAKLVRAWDLAITDDESSDYTVGALVAGSRLPLTESVARTLHDARLPLPWAIHVQDLAIKRATWPHQRQFILETARRDGPAVPIAFEYTRLDLAAVQQVMGDLQNLGHTCRKVHPKGDKVARKGALSVICQRGDLSFAPGEWNEQAWRQFHHFPLWNHDDIVDAIELGTAQLMGNSWDFEVI